MKKILTILTIICLFVSCVAYGSSSPEISVSNLVAGPGQQVTVEIAVNGNPGFAAMMTELTYDSKTLTPVSVSGGGVVNGASVISNIQQGGDLKAYNPITLFVVSPSDFSGDGVVFSIVFAVDQNASSGKTDLTLKWGEEDIANQNLENVEFGINQGSITIEGGSDDVASSDAPQPEVKPGEEEQPLEIPSDGSASAAIPEATPEKDAAPTPDIAKKEVTITLDGKNITFDQPPIIVNGRTLVPMRAIFEALGADVDWEGDTRTAVGVRDGITIRIQIDNNIMKKNGTDITLDVPAQLVNSRTLVPIRAISESFGCKVDWVESTKTVVILTK